jgi:hypothetical protein
MFELNEAYVSKWCAIILIAVCFKFENGQSKYGKLKQNETSLVLRDEFFPRRQVRIAHRAQASVVHIMHTIFPFNGKEK